MRLDTKTRAENIVKYATKLENMVIGQPNAIHPVLNAFQRWAVGMSDPSRPVSNILLLGPTGTGKTHLVESVARTFIGTSEALIKIDCAEYQHSHEIAKLVGSPPGYLGHSETHALLTQTKLEEYYEDRINKEKHQINFILFDEIEKSSDSLWDLLLGIMDKATLTLGNNKKVNFSKTMIFLTSNISARELSQIGRANLGFHQIEAPADGAEKLSFAAAKKIFTPEFMNRLDHVVTFDFLGKESISKILALELKRVEKLSGLKLDPSDSVKEHLVEKGFSKEYGARYLKRLMEKTLENPLSSLLYTGQVKPGEMIHIDLENGEFVFDDSKVMEPVLVDLTAAEPEIKKKTKKKPILSEYEVKTIKEINEYFIAQNKAKDDEEPEKSGPIPMGKGKPALRKNPWLD